MATSEASVRIGYTLEEGKTEHEVKPGDMVIIVGTEEAKLQEYIVEALIAATDDPENQAMLKGVMQYACVTSDIQQS